MPSIEFYLGPEDGELLLSWLKSQREIAFATRSATEEPRLKDPPASLSEGQYALFHTSYAELPTRPAASEADRSLTSELYDLMKSLPPEDTPRLDESHPAVFTLAIWYRATTLGAGGVGLSGFGWIGGRYESEGLHVSPQARAWWRRLRGWVSASSRRVSRSGALEDVSPGSEAYAFPQALALLEAGAPRATNVGD